MNERNRDPLRFLAQWSPELYQSLSNTFYLYLRAMHDLINTTVPLGTLAPGFRMPYSSTSFKLARARSKPSGVGGIQ